MDNKQLNWVKKACSKDKGRLGLMEPWRWEDCIVGSDGFRLHMYKDNKHIIERDIALSFPDITSIVNAVRQGQIIGTISKYHLKQAAKHVGVIAKEVAKSIRLDFRPHELEVSAKCAVLGESHCHIVNDEIWRGKSTKVKFPNGKPYQVRYTIKGEPVSIALNYRYLLQAIQGMEDIIEFRLKDSNRPIYLTSDNKEAIIMPMHLGR